MARPRWLFGFPSRSGGDIDADIRDEIAFHLDARVQELVDRGWTREAAVREAARQFGSPAETAAYCRNLDIHTERHVRLSRLVDEFRQDLAYTMRTFAAQPAFTAVALLTIALGIGATTLVFSVVYRSLLAPLPYAHAERLMIVRASIPDYADLRASTDAFEDSGIYASNQYLLDEEQTLGGVVSPGVFTTLGVTPIVGRTIDASDGAAPVVVLSYSLWQRKYGGDPNVIGRTIQLYGTGYTVVGVMPLGFQFPARTFQLWVGFDHAITQVPQQATNRALRIWQVVGRLKPSVTQAQAQAQLTALAGRLEQTYPATNTQVALTLVALRERLVGNSRAALLMALGAVGCLLLIACANVASLTLTRLTARTQELAVRAALGAGRWRIARQLATESLLTAACGGAIGVLGAWWGLSALPALIGNRVPRVDEVALSLPVLAVSIAAIVLGGLFVAVLPIVHLSMAQIEPMLRAGGRHGGEIRFGVRLRSALVVAQIGLTVVVLAGSLVLTRSFLRLVTVDAGFSPDRLLAFNVPLIGQKTSAERVDTASRVLESIAAIPGVTAAGGATGLAPITAQRSTTFEVDGRADAAADERRAYFIAASPAYFQALGTPVVAGRAFTAADREGSAPVAIVSRTLARRFFADANPIGRRLRLVNPEVLERLANDCRRRRRCSLFGPGRFGPAGGVYAVRADPIPVDLRPRARRGGSDGRPRVDPHRDQGGGSPADPCESSADDRVDVGVLRGSAVQSDADLAVRGCGHGAGGNRPARRDRVRRRQARTRDRDPARARRHPDVGAVARHLTGAAAGVGRPGGGTRRRLRPGRHAGGDALRNVARGSDRARGSGRPPAPHRDCRERAPRATGDACAAG